MFSKISSFTFLFFIFITSSLEAQIVKDGDFGKTYYDSSYSKVCEIFHHDLRYVFIENKNTKEQIYKDRIIIKNGPYLSYFENGKLESSGFYVNNEKDSIWMYYKPNGQIHKIEKYRFDQLIE
jgi:antitoxin component YwqK of YwqJK toxin-antitoxin module